MIAATNNLGKLNEIKQILCDYEIQSLNDKKILVDVIEDGKTFYDNALKKAKEIYAIAGEPVIADDSGLCIDYFNGWPGVYTHRFLDNSSDYERNEYILNKMKEITLRDAQSVCVIVYYDGEKIITTTGTINGNISKTQKGSNGFGYDTIFELDNGLTLAELSEEEKNKISARFIALSKLEKELRKEVKNEICRYTR